MGQDKPKVKIPIPWSIIQWVLTDDEIGLRKNRTQFDRDFLIKCYLFIALYRMEQDVNPLSRDSMDGWDRERKEALRKRQSMAACA